MAFGITPGGPDFGSITGAFSPGRNLASSLGSFGDLGSFGSLNQFVGADPFSPVGSLGGGRIGAQGLGSGLGGDPNALLGGGGNPMALLGGGGLGSFGSLGGVPSPSPLAANFGGGPQDAFQAGFQQAQQAEELQEVMAQMQQLMARMGGMPGGGAGPSPFGGPAISGSVNGVPFQGLV